MNIYLIGIITGYLLFFVYQTIFKLPRDVSTLIEYYGKRKMTDFYVHSAVVAGYWGVSVIFIYIFIYPTVKLALGGLGDLVKLALTLGR